MDEKKPDTDEREKPERELPEEKADIDALIALLDGYTTAGENRIRLDVVEGKGEVISHQYHHGRCDIGSPWACGTPFDVLED